MAWKRLTLEAKTPSDEMSIDASFNKDVSNELYTPTEKFIKTAYGKLNQELFLGFLPSAKEVKFELSDDIRGDELGGSRMYDKHGKKQGVGVRFQVVF